MPPKIIFNIRERQLTADGREQVLEDGGPDSQDGECDEEDAQAPDNNDWKKNGHHRPPLAQAMGLLKPYAPQTEGVDCKDDAPQEGKRTEHTGG